MIEVMAAIIATGDIEWGSVQGWCMFGLAVIGGIILIRIQLVRQDGEILAVKDRLAGAEKDIETNARDIKQWPDRLTKLELQFEHLDKGTQQIRVDLKSATDQQSLKFDRFEEYFRKKAHDSANDLNVISLKLTEITTVIQGLVEDQKEQRSRDRKGQQ